MARELGVRLRYVIETEPLGTGGGVRNAADLARGTVFVLNGDVLTDADLTAMRRLHETRRSRTTIFLMPVPDPRAFGLVELDADGRLTRFREKPTADEPITTNTINAGIYLIDARPARPDPDRPIGLDRARVLPRADHRRDPALRLDRPGVLARHRQPGRVPRRPDRPAERARALAAAAAGRAARRLMDRADDAPGRRDARVVGPSQVGADVEVRARARVGPLAVVGDGCRIAEDARVEGAILWERVSVGRGRNPPRLRDRRRASGSAPTPASALASSWSPAPSSPTTPRSTADGPRGRRLRRARRPRDATVLD